MITLKKIFLLIILIFSSSYAAKIDINKILQKTQNEDMHIMIFFHIPGCGYCERMLEENFKDKKVLEMIKNDFKLIDIYIDDEKEVIFKDFKGDIKSFVKYMKSNIYPTTLFIDKNAKIIHKAVGYRNIEEYIAELKYVSSKSYEKMNFEDFFEDWEFSKDD